jgi:hypothetical protein
MDYWINQVVGRGGMRQIFDILVKNLDNLLQLLHSINVWCGNEQSYRS